MAYILAYDFGTGGIKASLYNDQGHCLADGFDAYETLYPAPGFHEQRPQDWWQATVQSTRKLLATAPSGAASEVTAIGISGHSLGVVPMDAQGRLLREAVPIWSDARPDTQPAEFFAHIAEADWYNLTGSGFPPPLYSIFKLMWFRDHEPEMFKQIYKVLGTKDYINFRLCGVMATDQSYASGSGVYDLRQRRYCEKLLSAASIPRELLAEIVPSTHVLGCLTADAAAELGLSRKVQVVAGGVTNSCMSLGAGAFKEGRAYNSLGSSSWIALSSSAPLLEPIKRPYVFDHVVPGQYVSALAIFAAGSSLSWVASQLCRDLKLRAEREGVSLYRLIDEEAATSPLGANGVLFNPSLAGGSSLDLTPAVRGAFMGLDLRQTRADLLRAAMEGIAFGLRGVLDELRAMTQVAEPLTLVGGGANSLFWRQIYANVYHMSVVRSNAGQQAAALGAAVIAGVGTGIWPDFGIVDAISAATERSEPDPQSAAQYEQILLKYQQAAKLLGVWA
ncbi:MAG: FGGY family carbohydrate kinase [Kiritimatiellae bacterium]|nr:FGGY family carbohydrate kinase [Kiritimatiellia bacterium]